MIHSEIVQFLSEIDTNIFLFFNGIHSPFWDYFMSSFTGKIIWVPMYATILYILSSNPQPIGFRGNLLVKRQKFFYCTYSLGITETS